MAMMMAEYCQTEFELMKAVLESLVPGLRLAALFALGHPQNALLQNCLGQLPIALPHTALGPLDTPLIQTVLGLLRAALG